MISGMKNDIVIAGSVGAYGTAVLCENRSEELSAYFNKGFLKQALELKERSLEDMKKAEMFAKENALTFVNAGECGIYKALWDLGEELSAGFNLNMRRFPIAQHTVEICEFFDISPYELYSKGAVCIASACGTKTVEKLGLLGINAALVGYTTDNNDRLLYYDEEARFLKYTKKDALFKVIRKSRIPEFQMII